MFSLKRDISTKKKRKNGMDARHKVRSGDTPKPSFAMKPSGFKKPAFNAVPNQTPNKAYDDGGNQAGVQDLAESAAH